MRRRCDVMISEDTDLVALACNVLPMGWGSSVAIMQEISEGRLSIPTMPAETQIRRGKPMPLWMFCLLEEAHKGGKFWWHVCVDNFAAGQDDKREGNFTGGDGTSIG